MISNVPTIKRTHVGMIDFMAGVIIGLSAIVFLLLIPEIASMIQDLAMRTGYGSAKRFFFVVKNPPPYLVLVGIYIFSNAVLCFVAGYSLLKNKRWGAVFNVVVWGVEFINVSLVVITVMVISGI